MGKELAAPHVTLSVATMLDHACQSSGFAVRETLREDERFLIHCL
jgi:hypothetical protein